MVYSILQFLVVIEQLLRILLMVYLVTIASNYISRINKVNSKEWEYIGDKEDQ